MRETTMKKTNEIMQEVQKVLIGKDEEIRKVMMVILAKGHVLLEDIPGVGKTTLANAFAKAMQLKSRRIQFTVDVLPSDVVGFRVIHPESGKPTLHKGAVFCNIFLADEINRTSSKTQAALLEVMEEGRITVDGHTQEALKPFTVIATQNPFGSAGTQLLPESQLDRFMIRITLGYPGVNEEIEMLKRKQGEQIVVCPVADENDILTMQEECDKTFVHDSILSYVVQLTNATRNHAKIYQGASPRASISLIRMAKACAYLENRDYVIPEDVKRIFFDVMTHRILMKSEISKDHKAQKDVLNEILQRIVEPQVGLSK